MNTEDLTHLTDLPLPLLDPPICPSVCSPPFSTHHGTPCSWASIWVGTKSAVEDHRVGGEGVEGKEGIHFPALSLLGQHGLVAVST